MISEWKKLPDNIKRLIRQHQDQPPVPVGALARNLGLEVLLATLKPGISGELRPSNREGGKYVIRVNRHEVKARQRFTIAHEIAHYLLHRDHIGSGIVDNTLYRSELSDIREHQANRLAAEILMPWHLIDTEVNSGRTTPEALAERLGVSETAIKIRLDIPV